MENGVSVQMVQCDEYIQIIFPDLKQAIKFINVVFKNSDDIEIRMKYI